MKVVPVNRKQYNQVEKRRKQVIVSSFYSSTGGMSAFVKNIHKNSNLKDTDTYVISSDLYQTLPAKMFVRLSKKRFLSALQLFGSLMRIEPDHIQSHGKWYLNASVVMYAFYCKISVLRKKPTIFVIKHTDLIDHKLKTAIFKLIDTCFDKVFFPSHFFKDKCVDIAGYPECKSYVVYPGVPEIQNATEDGIPLNLDPQKKIISYVGKFVLPKKVEGLLMLIDAFSIVVKKRPDIMLLMVGDGPYKEVIQKKITDYDINESNYKMLGGVHVTKEIYKVSSLHCHISFGDTFGLVVLEALSMNKNVLINDVGDFLKFSDIDGLYFSENDKNHIADMILSLIDRSDNKASQCIEKYFSWGAAAALLGNCRSE